MHRTASTWSEFKEWWKGPLNFRITGECRLPAFPLPPVEDVVDIVRRDPDSRIWRGKQGDTLDKVDISGEFRALPIEQAMDRMFQLSHFKLTNFYGPGAFLHGFEDTCLRPWLDTLETQGFTFERFYPIIFISGRNCATNYHFDPTNVLAWQVYGTKVWHGMKDSDRWTPRSARMEWKSHPKRPEGIAEDDLLTYEMKPGDQLWNAVLTPHWVIGGNDGVSMSINVAVDRLRLDGRLAPNEQELCDDLLARGEDVVVTGKSPGEY